MSLNASNGADGQAQARHLILGTAGHIDHGKTTLIKALTGIDTDRLPEEKRRGMTIELGFAHLEIGHPGDGVQFGIVDVPGHEKFVRTMVAGAQGIDLVLVVIAADDSVMPQTREHVDILHLLGVRQGVVAITKCDLVDAEMTELVADEVAELLADTPMADFPVVPVSAMSGSGLDHLRESLLLQASRVPLREQSSVFRLPIDRVFTIHGRGTVVTGSAVSGRVAEGQELELLPRGRKCKVRGLQTHSDEASALNVGQRVAVNLTGIDKDQVCRGDELATPGYLTPSHYLDARLSALTSNARPLQRYQRMRLCMGTRESLTTVVLLEAKTIEPGNSALVQFMLAEPVIADHGQRFIVRDETNTVPLGGGDILRPVARRWRRSHTADLAGLQQLIRTDPLDRLEEVVRYEHNPAEGPALDELTLSNRAGVAPEQIASLLSELLQQKRLITLPDQRMVSAALIEDCKEQAVHKLSKFHQQHPDEPGMASDVFAGWLKRRWGARTGEHLFERLRKDEVKILGRYCCLAAFAPKMSAEEQRHLESIVGEFERAAFQPPAPGALASAAGMDQKRLQKLLKIATATGQLVQIAPDFLLHTQRMETLKQMISDRVAESGGVAISDVRTMTDSSRKFVVPLMEYLDKSGFTKRVGDKRVLA